MDIINFAKKEFFKLTLEEIKAININKIKVEDEFLIFYFIKDNQIELIKILIKYSDSIDLNVKNMAGYTPLIYACYYNNLEMVKLLLSRGINIKDETVSLYWACLYINFEMITLLLENGVIPEVDEEGKYKCLRSVVEEENKQKLQDFIFKFQSLNIKKVK